MVRRRVGFLTVDDNSVGAPDRWQVVGEREKAAPADPSPIAHAPSRTGSARAASSISQEVRPKPPSRHGAPRRSRLSAEPQAVADRDPRPPSNRRSNDPTEGLNLCLKKVRRAGRGFRCFEHYKLRVLHAGGVTWPQRPRAPRIRTRSSTQTRREPLLRSGGRCDVAGESLCEFGQEAHQVWVD